MLRFVSVRCAARRETGLYFPINHRIIDRRIAPYVASQEVDIQSRYRKELRTSFMTGETRQTVVPGWSARSRPTHFIALRLPTGCALVTRAAQLQSDIRFSHSTYSDLLVPIERLHLTLGVMTVPPEEETLLPQVHAAVEEVCASFDALPLRFRGLGVFNEGRVVFIRSIAEGGFSRLDTMVRALRQALGVGLHVDMKGNPHDSYVPHITLAKIRPEQRAQFGSKIPQEVWARFQHHDFGQVRLSEVNICSMQGSGEDGFYQVTSKTFLKS